MNEAGFRVLVAEDEATFGLTVAPDIRRQDRLVPLVDPVAHRLAHQMV